MNIMRVIFLHGTDITISVVIPLGCPQLLLVLDILLRYFMSVYINDFYTFCSGKSDLNSQVTIHLKLNYSLLRNG